MTTPTTQHTLLHFKGLSSCWVFLSSVLSLPEFPANFCFCVCHSGDTDSETAALGYFITPCVGTVVTLLSYVLLPRWVSQLPAYITHNPFSLR